MVAKSNNNIDMVGQLAVVAKVETNPQTLAPTPNERPNEHSTQITVAEQWLMEFCGNMRQNAQQIVAQNENVSRNTEKYGENTGPTGSRTARDKAGHGQIR